MCVYFMALLIFLSLDKLLLLPHPQIFFSFLFSLFFFPSFCLSSRVFEADQFIINHLMKLCPAQTFALTCATNQINIISCFY